MCRKIRTSRHQFPSRQFHPTYQIAEVKYSKALTHFSHPGSPPTRAVVVGEQDDTFRKIYDIVLGAQLTAINTVKVGMTGEECDKLARTVISEAGYGDNFGHSLGHGGGTSRA